MYIYNICFEVGLKGASSFATMMKLNPAVNSFNSHTAVKSLFASRCVCYLAVHDEVADAAGEVFVLKLRVDVGDVLVDATELEHVAHVQVSETWRGMDSHTGFEQQHPQQSGFIVVKRKGLP